MLKVHPAKNSLGRDVGMVIPALLLLGNDAKSGLVKPVFRWGWGHGEGGVYLCNNQH